MSAMSSAVPDQPDWVLTWKGSGSVGAPYVGSSWFGTVPMAHVPGWPEQVPWVLDLAFRSVGGMNLIQPTMLILCPYTCLLEHLTPLC